MVGSNGQSFSALGGASSRVVYSAPCTHCWAVVGGENDEAKRTTSSGRGSAAFCYYYSFRVLLFSVDFPSSSQVVLRGYNPGEYSISISVYIQQNPKTQPDLTSGRQLSSQNSPTPRSPPSLSSRAATPSDSHGPSSTRSRRHCLRRMFNSKVSGPSWNFRQPTFLAAVPSPSLARTARTSAAESNVITELTTSVGGIYD